MLDRGSREHYTTLEKPRFVKKLKLKLFPKIHLSRLKNYKALVGLCYIISKTSPSS